jgi:hypothetical protein
MLIIRRQACRGQFGNWASQALFRGGRGLGTDRVARALTAAHPDCGVEQGHSEHDCDQQQK